MAGLPVEDILYNSSLMASDCSGAVYLKSGLFVAMTTLIQLVALLSIVLPASFIVSAILQHPQLNNFRYWFAASIICCRILMAIIFLPTAIDTASNMFNNQGYSFQLVSGFAYAVPTACCLMDFVVYCDIFSFLFIPRYQDYLTKKKALVLVGAVWVMSYIIMILFNLVEDSTNDLYGCNVLINEVTILFITKAMMGMILLCSGMALFYYWTKLTIKIEEEVLSTSDNCDAHLLRKQVEKFVKIESCMGPFIAFSAVTVCGVATEMVKAVVMLVTGGFIQTPFSFSFFIFLTWCECVFCIITYSTLYCVKFHLFCFNNNQIFPA